MCSQTCQWKREVEEKCNRNKDKKTKSKSWVVRDVAMETISTSQDQHSGSHPYIPSVTVIYHPIPSNPLPLKPWKLNIVKFSLYVCLQGGEGHAYVCLCACIHIYMCAHERMLYVYAFRRSLERVEWIS